MNRLVISVGVAAVAAIALASGAGAQEASLDDVKARFAGLTQAEALAMGYVVPAPICVDASALPPPALVALGIPASAAMGIHAVNVQLFDTTADPLEPEVVIFGPDGSVWGVEYETDAATADATVLGQEMPLLEGGHEGMEFDHYALHVWFVENPAGPFADFNPALTCSLQAPETGSAGLADAGRTAGPATLLAALALAATVLGGARLLTGRRRP